MLFNLRDCIITWTIQSPEVINELIDSSFVFIHLFWLATTLPPSFIVFCSLLLLPIDFFSFWFVFVFLDYFSQAPVFINLFIIDMSTSIVNRITFLRKVLDMLAYYLWDWTAVRTFINFIWGLSWCIGQRISRFFIHWSHIPVVLLYLFKQLFVISHGVEFGNASIFLQFDSVAFSKLVKDFKFRHCVCTSASLKFWSPLKFNWLRSLIIDFVVVFHSRILLRNYKFINELPLNLS